MKTKNNKKAVDITCAADCFPNDEEFKKITHQRAKQLAENALENSENMTIENYICFHLGLNEKYGIDYKYTKEVIHHATITKLPCAEHFIAGILNRRGALIAVVDLQKLFFNKSTAQQESYNIIIANNNKMTIGIIADQIESNNNYDPTSLAATLPSESLTKSEFILGLDRGKIAIINMEAVMANLASATKTNPLIKE